MREHKADTNLWTRITDRAARGLIKKTCRTKKPIKFMRSKRKTARRKAARRTPPARTATELKTIMQPTPRQKEAKTPPRKIKIPPPTLNTTI